MIDEVFADYICCFSTSGVILSRGLASAFSGGPISSGCKSSLFFPTYTPSDCTDHMNADRFRV